MSYAIVKIGGKQYKVFSQETITVDKRDGAKGEKVKIDDVLLLVKDGKTQIGRPKIENVSITATILDQIKAKKQRVVKFRPKSRYMRVKGARRFLTKLEIGPFEEKKEKKKDS
ncbi:50S ribosomal protein L21 [Candidatus Curtissbacteria bacterium RBG_16_39_7]|uniref:Large ribosomal subunit protein bL21 n=1 Tax=Candidatus Curtissbacteria bacterium RBG_16_39_7 TaxID=1797707 RepID=A0A1F5G2P9_9BACT|nr:MAG: 50S ribosomal protein L21 [Candidatus Curtissbacteria bacterium RBG_16_39_7]